MTSVNKPWFSRKGWNFHAAVLQWGVVKEEYRFTYAGGKQKQLKFSAAVSESVALEAVEEFKITAQCTDSLAHRCDHGHVKGMAQGFEVFRSFAKREVFRNIRYLVNKIYKSLRFIVQD